MAQATISKGFKLLLHMFSYQSSQSNPRAGTPALTSRGFIHCNFKKVAEYFDVAVKIALQIKENSK
ncbi:serine hydroxymethyltransferase mitochondrial-like, partial [Trifolium pratense]